MNRNQWNVDEDLSRLKNEIKGSMSQLKNSDDDKLVHHAHHQQIKGNSNVQVAGNLTLNERKTIDSNHPDAIECPQCRELTYRLSHWCTECNFNLHDYWADLARKRIRSRFIKVMVYCGTIGLLIIFAGTMILTGKDVLYPLGIGGGLVAMAYAASLRIDKI